MPNKKHSLILFGDSLLGRFGKSLIQELESSVDNLTVLNCAAGGFNSHDGVIRADTIAQLKPDYVVLSFGANDCAPWKETIPLNNYTSNLDAILKSFPHTKVILLLCPPADNRFQESDVEEFNQLLHQYNHAAQDTAVKNSAVTIDLKSAYGNLLKNGHDYHMGDGIHLNELGYQVFVDELVKHISDKIK